MWPTACMGSPFSTSSPALVIVLFLIIAILIWCVVDSGFLFLFWMTFSWLPSLSETYNTVFSWNSERSILVLLLILAVKSIQFFAVEYNVSCGLVPDSCYDVEVCSFYI
jgi:hypothetical protein